MAWSCFVHFRKAASMFFTSSAPSGFMCASGRRETFMSLVISDSTQACFGNRWSKSDHLC